MANGRDTGPVRPGFMRRLRRDVGGNTMAMMAMFLIPISALTGSAVDVGRLYLVKVRLQQACDAGALAGRKFMLDSNSTTLDSNAIAQAKTFFANNFPSGIMGTPAYSSSTTPYPFQPVKTSDNQVSATATTQVPMTIMKMFGQPAQTLTVTCGARYDIADTDIMFVLDTTGSMACTPSGNCTNSISTYTRPDNTGTGYYAVEASGSKLSGLRTAVLNFYDTMAANIDAGTHVRYGFVTYSSAVNAGRAVASVNTNYLVQAAAYQSRRIVGDYVVSTDPSYTVPASSQAACLAKEVRTPATYTAVDPFGTPYTVYPFDTSGRATNIDATWSSTNSTCTLQVQRVKPLWRYMPVPYNVSALVTTSEVADPSKLPGVKSTWQGCIEERITTAGVTSFDIQNLPPDLNPDLIPTNDDTRWRPMWHDVIYNRPTNTALTYKDEGGSVTDTYGNTKNTGQLADFTPMSQTNNIQSGFATCGKPVVRLKTMSRSDVSNYVNAVDFKAQGGTYHDVGMIWGTRMIAPNGIFGSDTSAWPGRQAPNRYIVFMTDGDMAPNEKIYGMYGLERLDRRISAGNTGSLENYHNKRFVAECSAAKARGIKVFVVGFGQALTNELTTCASPGQAYYASDNAALNNAFQTIAKAVAMLRVSQ